MEKNCTRFVFMILLLQGFWMNAQERLVAVSFNPQLADVPAKNSLAARTASVSGLDTIPFFEDFFYSSVSAYPSPKHWIDSNVFINHTFPIAPPSFGVATFDGLNKKGYPYNLSAQATSTGPADKLTSRPINLQKKGNFSYSPANNIYFSFYYQSTGRGNDPIAQDSLCLDFYKPNQKKWTTVWGRKGYLPAEADSLFHLVMLPVLDTAYFDSLFQFRFRNKATLSGNNDHWHIDYIYIDQNRTPGDSIMDDIAFQYMSTPFLKHYSTMPYRQYRRSEMAHSTGSYIRNNFTNGKIINYNYRIFDINTDTVNFYDGRSGNIPPYNPNGLHTLAQHANPADTFAFAPMTDMRVYTIKHVISSGPDLQRQNDTIFQTQRFSDYYAYDDGTAEQAYSLGAYGSKMALRYTIHVSDTLRAMRIYFNPITAGPVVIASSFRMMVWADGINGPGNVIYRDSAMYPQYLQGKYNLAPVYALTSCKILSPGTYYFGIQQTTGQGLNIGFDKNTDHSNALYFDSGNGWEPSVFKGSLMINPVLGCYLPVLPVNIKEGLLPENELLIFPNPAQNFLTLEAKGTILENARVTILSSIGQIVYSAPYTDHKAMDLSALPSGVYFVQLTNGSASPVITKKLIIAR